MKATNLIYVIQFLFIIVGCDKIESKPPDGGWYLISDDRQILGNAIFDKNDIDAVWIESSLKDKKKTYVIIGNFTPDAKIKLSTFTEENIGKRFGFVLDNEIISSDIINHKDEKGEFSIVCIEKSKANRAYKSLLVEK